MYSSFTFCPKDVKTFALGWTDPVVIENTGCHGNAKHSFYFENTCNYMRP